MPAEHASALKKKKKRLGKASGRDSIWPVLIIHAGAVLKSWLCGFISSCLLHLGMPSAWRRGSRSHDPKVIKTKRATVKSLCSVFPIRSSKSLSKPALNPLLIHCSLLSRQDFGEGSQLWIKQFC